MKSVESSEKKKVRPEGLNTVEMLKHASIYLGLGPHDTMRVAERLYLNGYITYPRTETTSYAENFEFKQVVDKIKENYDRHEIKNYAARLVINKPKKGVDVGDHPPITPTTKIPNGLASVESRYRSADTVSTSMSAETSWQAFLPMQSPKTPK